MTPYFSSPNTKLKKLQKKLKKKVYSFDLLSGWSCPNAEHCKSKVHNINSRRKVVDGPNTWYRCFSASQEALYTHVYYRRRDNLNLVKTYHSQPNFLVNLLSSHLPKDLEVLRWHVAGDFFSKNYFKAAIKIAQLNPGIIFYAYTKCVKHWVELRDTAPNNFRITISIGGLEDHLIDNRMKTARVIYNPEEQIIWGLDIDEDDFHAYNINRDDFLLLIHGIQPAKMTLCA